MILPWRTKKRANADLLCFASRFDHHFTVGKLQSSLKFSGILSRRLPSGFWIGIRRDASGEVSHYRRHDLHRSAASVIFGLAQLISKSVLRYGPSGFTNFSAKIPDLKKS